MTTKFNKKDYSKNTIACVQSILKNPKKFTLVKGDIQSGKSMLLIALSRFMVKYKDVIVILRNSIADVNSLTLKFENLGVRVTTKYKQEKFKQVLIVPGNHYQLEKIKFTDYVLLIDEFDFNEKNNTTKYYESYKKIYKTADKVIGVTGTVFPSLFRQNLESSQIVVLKPPETYKGIQQINFIPKMVKNLNDIKEILTGIPESTFVDCNGDFHPNILLLKETQVKAFQISISNKLILDKWKFFVYNGDGVVYVDSKHTVKESINETLQTLKNQGNTDNICIISGKLADRGLSFVSTDYIWHLTHMILLSGNNTPGTSLCQSIRLCGVYKDQIPLTCYSKSDTINEIYSYNSMQYDILKSIKQSSNSTDIIDIIKKIIFVYPVVNRNLSSDISLIQRDYRDGKSIFSFEFIDTLAFIPKKKHSIGA